MSAQLYRNTLFGTITLDYTAPLCLTISSYDDYTVYHKVSFGTITSDHMAP